MKGHEESRVIRRQKSEYKRQGEEDEEGEMNRERVVVAEVETSKKAAIP